MERHVQTNDIRGQEATGCRFAPVPIAKCDGAGVLFTGINAIRWELPFLRRGSGVRNTADLPPPWIGHSEDVIVSPRQVKAETFWKSPSQASSARDTGGNILTAPLSAVIFLLGYEYML